MVSTSKKFRLNFIQEIALEKKHTSFRYYVAMNLFDLQGQGWVSKANFVPFVAKHFGVTQKTVQNNLQKLHTLAWVNNTPDRVYYRNQEFVLSTMHPHHRTNRAIYMSMDDIGGDIVDFRAYLHECVLAGQIKSDSVTIARDTIHDQLNGHGKKTQRKYEKMRSVQTVYNFARLDGDDNLEMTYKFNQPVFPVVPDDLNDDLYFVRQLPNTYISKIKIGKRIRRHKYGSNKLYQPTICPKLYFHQDDTKKNVNRMVYLETNELVMSGLLWDEIWIE